MRRNKKSKCLYYSVYLPTNDIRYYCMAYNSIYTLSQYYDDSFDVLVFLHIPGYKEDKYLINNKYNISKDFSFVKVIQSDYHVKYNVIHKRPYIHDAWMSKWYHLQEVFNLGYNQAMFLDCDSIFTKNPGYLFDKYIGNYLWTLSCSDPVGQQLFPEHMHMNSGQFIVKNPKDSRLYNRIVIKRKQLSRLAKVKLFNKGKITDSQLNNYEYFNEQYCGQMHLSDIGFETKEFDFLELVHPAANISYSYKNLKKEDSNGYVNYGVELYDNGECNLVNVDNKTTVIHYSSGKSPFMVNKNFRNKTLSNNFNALLKDIVRHTRQSDEKWRLLFK